MDKFEQREFSMSHHLAKLVGFQVDENLNFKDRDGWRVFNPFTSKTAAFDVLMWAAGEGIQIAIFKQNLTVTSKTGKVYRRIFEPNADARNTALMETISLAAGWEGDITK